VLIDVRPKLVYRPLAQYLTQVCLEILTDLFDAERQAQEKYEPREKAEVRLAEIASAKAAVDEEDPDILGMHQLESGCRGD